MPRIFFTHSRTQPLLISIDEAVGPGCANKRPDVLLVQFMMKVAHDSPQNANFWSLKSGSSLKIDGVCGQHTQSMIKLFQDHINAVVQDGRIDPVTNGTFFGSRHGKLMTMIALNMAYLQGAATDHLWTMPHHGWWPRELTPLMQVRLN
jgi:hypothetical protein